MAKHTYLK